jgi:hypothetical protein
MEGWSSRGDRIGKQRNGHIAARKTLSHNAGADNCG